MVEIAQAQNYVRIVGLLSEISLNLGSYTDKHTGENVENISGTIKVLVEQSDKVKGKITCEIPVSLYANKFKKGTTEISPAYKSIKDILDSYVSIAASSYEQADAIRITTGAHIEMNEYPNRDGKLVSFPRIRASFVNKIKRTEMKPEATFSVHFVVGSKINEVDKDGVETGRLIVKGILPQYGNKIDIIPFYVENERAIASISSYWNPYDTVSARGKIMFTSIVETKEIPVDFGEPEVREYTKNISDLVITAGTEAPLDGEQSYEKEVIDAAVAEHQKELETRIKQNKAPATKAPVQSAPNMMNKLGF